MEYLSNRGTLVCLGLPHESFSVHPIPVVNKALRIVGTAIGSRRDAREAMIIAAMGKVKANVEIRPFDKLADTYRDLDANKVSGRVVLDMRDY